MDVLQSLEDIINLYKDGELQMAYSQETHLVMYLSGSAKYENIVASAFIRGKEYNSVPEKIEALTIAKNYLEARYVKRK